MENMEQEPIKTQKQIDAAERFKRFYDTKIRGTDLKRTCECGCIIAYMNLSRHKKTKKHMRLMKSDPSNLKSESNVL